MTYSSTFAVAATNTLMRPITQDLDKTSATAVMDLGTVVESKDGRRYQYIYYDSTGNEVKTSGQPVIWADSTTTYVCEGDMNNSAGGLDDAAGAGTAGVLCAACADTDADYRWIQTDGFCAGARVGTAVVANDILINSTTDLFEKQDYVTSVGSGTDQVICAFALGAATDATGGGNSVADVMLRCRGS